MMMLMILAAFSEFLMNLKSEVPSSVDVVVSLINPMGADGVGCSFGWVHHLLAPKPSMGIQGNNDLCSARLTPFPKLIRVHSLTFKSDIHACGLVVMTMLFIRHYCQNTICCHYCLKIATMFLCEGL